MTNSNFPESYIRQNTYSDPDKAIRIIDVSGLAITETGTLEFGETDVASGNELLVVQFEAPAGKQFVLLDIIAGGDGDGRWRLEIGTTKMVFRTAITEKSKEKRLAKGVEVPAGTIVKLYATNTTNKVRHYEASLYGVVA